MNSTREYSERFIEDLRKEVLALIMRISDLIDAMGSSPQSGSR